ncbi:MAG: ABC transporter ATP-binding protein [Planctomycetota bacterium]
MTPELQSPATGSPPSRTSAPPLSAPGAISVRGLSQRFGDKVALHPLDLDLEAGGVTGLLGPNGSGKSTLMRLLVGLIPLGEGEVHVDGLRLTGDGLAIRRRTTYAPGELHLYGEMKGAEHLRFLLRGRDRATVQRATATAESLGLPLNKRVRGYSHGMKRQLCFAAAMAPDVRIRILDEISEGLDPAKRSEVLDAIEADAARGTTVLLSSHHLGEVDRSCERLLFINEGKLIADESAASVSERAARLVRLTYADAAQLGEIEAAIEGAGVESIRRDDTSLHVLLDSNDPRALLGRLASRGDLPAPMALEHGKLSLRELYRSLYGVEGT